MSEVSREYDLFAHSFNAKKLPGIRVLPNEPLVGEGAQGWVLAAEYIDPDTNATIPAAIKVCRPSDSTSAEEVAQTREAFLNEARLLSRFRHPNIVKVLHGPDIHTVKSTVGKRRNRITSSTEYPFMVMERASDGSVAQRAKTLGILPVEEAVLSIFHATEGMRYAHAEEDVYPANITGSITHGDLKPPNFLIHSDGNRERIVQVADFGIARRGHHSEHSVTGTQFHAGTPAYMSAEQLATGRVLIKDDVYAMGVTAYELLSGRRPIEADPPANLWLWHLAHTTHVVQPMERIHEGKIDQIVEAFNVPILGALEGQYTSMGAFQTAFREALALGKAEANKDRTIIPLAGERTTLPLAADKLLQTGLPSLEDATTSAVKAHRRTSFLRNPSGSRRAVLLGVLGVTVGGIVGGSAYFNTSDNQPDNSPETKVKSAQEAADDLAWSIYDRIYQQKTDATDTLLLQQYLLASDATTFANKLAERIKTDNNPEHAFLGGLLATYEPGKAEEIMNAYIARGDFENAAFVGAGLATLKDAATANYPQITAAVQKLEDICRGNKLSDLTNLLFAARYPNQYEDPSVVPILLKRISETHMEEFLRRGMHWHARALSISLASNAPAVVESGMRALEAKIKVDTETTDNYRTLATFCGTLASYNAKAVRQTMQNLMDAGMPGYSEGWSHDIAMHLVKHDPQFVKDYIAAAGNSYERRNRRLLAAAFAQEDPELVRNIIGKKVKTVDGTAETEYAANAWLEAALSPLDGALAARALQNATNDGLEYIGATFGPALLLGWR